MGVDYFNNVCKLADFIFEYLDKEAENEEYEENINKYGKEKLNI